MSVGGGTARGPAIVPDGDDGVMNGRLILVNPQPGRGVSLPLPGERKERVGLTRREGLRTLVGSTGRAQSARGSAPARRARQASSNVCLRAARFSGPCVSPLGSDGVALGLLN